MGRKRNVSSPPFWRNRSRRGGNGNGRKSGSGTGSQIQLESLEPRILLSGDLLTLGVADALHEGVGQFGVLVNDFVLQEPLLDVQLPIVVRSGGDNLLNDYTVAPNIHDLLSVDADVNGDGIISGNEAGLYDAALDDDGDLTLDFTELFLGKFIGDLRGFLTDPLDLTGDGEVDSADLLAFLNDPARDDASTYTSDDYADRSYDLQVSAAQDLTSDHQLAWQLDFTLLFTNEMALDLGYQAEDLGIVPEASLMVDAAVSFSLQFGVLTSGEEASDSDFFVSVPGVMGIEVAAGDSGLSDDVRIGFLGTEVTNGSVVLEANVDALFSDPTSAGKTGFEPGQSGNENAGSVSAGNLLSNGSFGGNSSFTIRIGGAASQGGVDTREVRFDTGSFDASDQAGLADIQVQVQAALDDAGLSMVHASTGTGRLVLSLTGDPGALDITPIGFSGNELFSDRGDGTLKGTNTLNNAQVAGMTAPVNFLLSVDHALPERVSVNTGAASTVSQLVIQINLGLAAAGFTDVIAELDPDDDVIVLRSTLATPASLEVTRSLTVDSMISYQDLAEEPVGSIVDSEIRGVTFDGSDSSIVRKGLSSPDLVLIIPDHGYAGGELVVYNSGDGHSIGGLSDGSQYFVKTTTGSDTVRLTLTPGGDPIAYSTGPGTGNQHRLIDSRFDLKLPIQVKQGLLDASGSPFEPTANVSFDTPTHNPFEAASTPGVDGDPLLQTHDRDERFNFGIDLADISDGYQKQDLLNFTNLDASSVIGLFREFGRYLDGLGSGEDLAAYGIPFTQADLADIMDLGDAWTDAMLVDDLDNNDSGDDQYRLVDGNNNPVFDTAQELARELAQILILPLSGSVDGINATYDTATGDLTYNLQLVNELPSLEVPLDFNLPLDPLDNVVSDSTAWLVSAAGMGMVLGINLAPDDPGDFLTGSTTLAELGVEIKTDQAVTAEKAARIVYGRLRENATFDISVDGSDYRVIVYASDPDGEGLTPLTDDNLTAQNLADDIAGALATAVDKATDTEVDLTSLFGFETALDVGDPDRIAISADADFTISVKSGDPAMNELGFKKEHPSHEEGAGFSLTTTADVPRAVGVLTDDVSFTVDFGSDGAGVYTVTVQAAEAEPNLTVLDLVNDVNRALRLPSVISSTVTQFVLTDDVTFNVSVDGGAIVPVTVLPGATDGTAAPVFFDGNLDDKNLSENSITLTGHAFDTGEAVIYSSGGNAVIGGLEDGQVYYVFIVDADTIRLALTENDAVGGRTIELSGASTGTHTLRETPNADIEDLVQDINRAIGGTGLDGLLEAESYRWQGQSRILLKAADENVGQYELTAAAANSLGLPEQQLAGDLSGLMEAGSQGDRLVLTSSNGQDFTLEALTGNELGLADFAVSDSDDLVISLSNGTTHGVDLDGAVTIDDVIDRIHLDTGGLIVAQLNDPESATGLKLTDTTWDQANGELFFVQSTNASQAPLQLGVVRVDVTRDANEDGVINNLDADGVVDGAPIKGPALADRLFVEDAAVEAGFQFITPATSVSGIEVSASDPTRIVSSDLSVDHVGQIIDIEASTDAALKEFAAGSYRVLAVEADDLDPDLYIATLDRSAGDPGAVDGVGEFKGVQATAGLGYVDVLLHGEGTLAGLVSMTLEQNGDKGVEAITHTAPVVTGQVGDGFGSLVFDVTVAPDLSAMVQGAVDPLDPVITLTVDNMGDPTHEEIFTGAVLRAADRIEIPGDQTSWFTRGSTAEVQPEPSTPEQSKTYKAEISDRVFEEGITSVQFRTGVLENYVGRLSRDAVLSLSVDGGDLVDVTILADDTDDNDSLFDLAADINAALAASELDGLIEAGVQDDHLTLKAVDPDAVTQFTLTAAADDTSVLEMGFDPDQISSGDGDVSIEAPKAWGLLLAAVTAAVPPHISVTRSGFNDLDAFDEIDFEDILTALQDLSGLLSDLETLGEMNDPLLLLERSVSDLVGLAGRFSQAVDTAGDNPALSLQTLQAKLTEAFSLAAAVYDTGDGLLVSADGSDTFTLSGNRSGEIVPGAKVNFDDVQNFETVVNDVSYDDTSDVTTVTVDDAVLPSGLTDVQVSNEFVDLSLDRTTADTPFLRFDLVLTQQFSQALDIAILDIDLTQLIEGIDLDELGLADAFVDLTAPGVLGVGGQMVLHLDFAVDLGDPAVEGDAGEAYLYDSTNISGNLAGLGENMNFRAGLGPFNLEIVAGSAEVEVLFGAGMTFSGARLLSGVDLNGEPGDAQSSVEDVIHSRFPAKFGGIEIGAFELSSNPGLTLPTGFVSDLVDDYTSEDSNLFDNILLAVDGIDFFLEGMQNLMDGEIFSFRLPLIGDQLADGARFIEDLRLDFVDPFRAAIQTADDVVRDFTDADKNIISGFLFDILGPEGIDLLLPVEGAEDPDAISSYVALESDLGGAIMDTYIQWNMTLGGTLYNPTPDIGFDLGIPGLNLSVDGNIELEISWELSFGFGLSFSDGFYLDISDPDELEFTVKVDLPASIKGTLGFLALSARDKDVDGDGDSTGLSATFGVDILNSVADDDSRMDFADLGHIGLDATLDARAAAELAMTLEVSGDLIGEDTAAGFPSIHSDFIFDWEVVDLRLSELLENSEGVGKGLTDAIKEGLQLVAFQDVTLDLGSYVSDVLGPVVDKIQDITEPIQPIIDILTEPIPVVSDLGPELTLLDIAAMAGRVDKRLLQAIADVITLINSIPDPSTAESLLLPFGSYVIYDNTSGLITAEMWDDDYDISKDTENLLNNPKAITKAFEDFDSALSDLKGGRNSKGVLGKMKDAGDFAFPIFEDPSQVFGLLTGKPAVLITYDMDPLVFEFEWSQFFSVFGPLGVSINMEFSATIDFAFGYDTLGIQEFVEDDFNNPLLLLDGFYVSDTDLATGDYGTDVPELTFSGGLWAAAELNLLIARAGVGGGIFAQVEFDLFDPDRDGRVRIKELLGNFENEWNYGSPALAPLAIFDVHGEVWARLFAFLEIDLVLFSFSYEFDITPPLTLFEFDIPFTRPPNLATETGDGNLQINAGGFAGQRLNYNTSDGSEVFTLWGGPGSLEVNVNAFGFTQDYDLGGSTIYISGGEGNDVFNLYGIKNPNVTAVIEGGSGNDRIYLTDPLGAGGSFAGKAIIRGDDGDDIIYGGSGSDEIYGGLGKDEIHAGGGDDIVFGDEGIKSSRSVRVFSGSGDGDDILFGDAGNDIIIGGGGVDTVDGGEHDDIILGDGGQVVFDIVDPLTAEDIPVRGQVSQVRDTVRDIYFAGDRLAGGSGDDEIYGGKGDDILDGGSGADLIFGEDGFDTIDGGSGVDTIYGDGWRMTGLRSGGLVDPGDLETTYGGEADVIHGGDGTDTIYGGGGADLIHGDGAGDHIYGGDGSDELHGDEGNDHLYGEGNPDLIFGGLGHDTLDGGEGDDRLFGGAARTGETSGNDTLYGGLGSDLLDGQGGSDSYVLSLRGADNSSLNEVFDSGTAPADTDRMVVNGTDFADQFLLRAGVGSSSKAFVALLNDFPNQGDYDNLERINYEGVERLIVNGLAGDDRFAVDDVRAEATINGGIGEDFFQVGQLYRSERTSEAANVDPEDEFATIEVTRGFLSNGISQPMTINGGADDDEFIVFHNLAVLTLNGGTGDDSFTVRAFALAGSTDTPRERTDIHGGGGADLIQYAVNAPVNIDGGDGLDTVIVIGTEFADDFVITEDGVFGAGLNVNFVDIEALRVDGAEGDDRFFVLSTGDDFRTEIVGGLGSDSFNIAGDTPPVVSNDLLGHSGVVVHGVESVGEDYDGLKVDGISANVADNDEPAVRVTRTGDSTVVGENGWGDSYTIVLTRQPTKDVSIKALAPARTPEEEAMESFNFLIRSTDGANEPDGSATTLLFTAENWYLPQTVTVSVPETTVIEELDVQGAESDTLVAGADAFTDSEGSELDLRGMRVRITSGPGEGQTRIIESNTGDTLFLTRDWDVVPVQSGDFPPTFDIVKPFEDEAVEGVRFGAVNHVVITEEAIVGGDGAEGVFTAGGDTLSASSVIVDGEVLGITSDTLVAAEGTFSDMDLAGAKVRIVQGAGSGQVRDIDFSEHDTLTLTSPWDPENGPEEGSVFEVIEMDSIMFSGLDLTGASVRITEGPGRGQVRLIESFSDSSLDLFTAWDPENLPDASSKFVVVTDDSFHDMVSASVPDTFQDFRARFPIAVGGLVDATVTVTDGNGTSESRTITANTVDTVTVDSPWSLMLDENCTYEVTRDSEPVLSNGFEIKGQVTSIVTRTFSAASSVLPPTDLSDPDNLINGLRAETIEVVAGTGVGQVRVVESTGTDSVTVTTPWTVELDETSEFIIRRYGNLALPSVKVRIEDNDEAGVVITQTNDTTDVIEGADGDTFGASDTYSVVLAREPLFPVTVTLHPDAQLTLTSEDSRFNDVPDDGLDPTITFTIDDWNVPVIVTVTAVDDDTREGYHYGYLTHSVSSADSDAVLPAEEEFGDLVDDPATSVLLMREPHRGYGTVTGATVDTLVDSTAPFATGGDGLEGFTVQITEGIGKGQIRTVLSNTADTLVLDEPWDPGAVPDVTSEYEITAPVVVTVDGEERDAGRYEVSSSTIIFLDKDGAPEELQGVVRVRYSWLVPGYDSAEVDRIVAGVGDNDAPGVLITESSGSTDVIEITDRTGIIAGTVLEGADRMIFADFGDLDLSGKTIRIVDGTGAGQSRAIEVNSAGEALVTEAWGVTPDATSAFEIIEETALSGAIDAAGNILFPLLTEPYFRISDNPVSGDLIGNTVEITSGPGSGQTRVVVDIQTLPFLTGQYIIVDSDWDAVPDTGSSYRIVTEVEVLLSGTVDHGIETVLVGDFSYEKLDGETVTITAGSGEGQVNTIMSLSCIGDLQFVVLEDAWGAEQIPDTSSEYEITITLEDVPWDDTYTVVLTKAPEFAEGTPVDQQVVKVTVTPRETRTTREKLATFTEQVVVTSEHPDAVNNDDGTVTLTFTLGDWDVPQTVKVIAIDDTLADGGDTKVFAPRLHTLIDVKGPLFINGAGGAGSLVGLTPPVLLPPDPFDLDDLPETNIKQATGEVMTVEGTTLTVYTDDVDEYDNLQDRTVEITGGPEAVIGQFRLILNAVDNQDGTTTLILNDPWDPDLTGYPGIEYAITRESLNFFVNEAERVDYLTVYNEDSVADREGSLIEANAVDKGAGYDKRLTGLGMGPDVQIGGVTQPGGITYGNMEITLIHLGSGVDTFNVETAGKREDFKTWTMLNTGAGDDVVTISLHAQDEFLFPAAMASGAGRDTLISTVPLPADNALAGAVIRITDGTGAGQTRTVVSHSEFNLKVGQAWEILPDATSQFEVVHLGDGAFTLNTQDGNDQVDGSSSTLPLVIFGWDGSDTIIGGQADDIIFGDRGRVDYLDESGDDIKVVTRLGSAPETITGSVIGAGEYSLMVELDDDLSIDQMPTEDGGLRGLVVWINEGTGAGQSRLILSNTGGEITVDSAWSVLPDETSQFRITGTPSDQTDGEFREAGFLFSSDPGVGGDDVIWGGMGEDLLIGGAGGDSMDGGSDADLIFGDNIKLDRTGDRMTDFTSPRFRALSGDIIYDAGDQDQIDDSVDYVDPAGAPAWATWDIFMSEEARFNQFGDDTIAGGAHDDMIFGQLGNDTLHGDGMIGSEGELFTLDDTTADGDDYMEGNGGSDTIYGGLGQDDIIGGSSDLFSLVTPDLRSDGTDTLFGGNGDMLARNNLGDLSDAGHARDADMILGDNGDIFRLVDRASGQLPAFYYDNYGSERIIPRAARLLDYSPGGPDYQPNAGAVGDIGAADTIHGESGDDFIYGMVGGDILFGEGQDDDIVGGYGNDWISGGTGQDGILGDDGRIWTSRNGLAEPLYGITPITQLDLYIATGGDIQNSIINVSNQLKKTANLTPFKLGDPAEPQYTATYDPLHADDIIFGGWGSDFLHGGDGDDAVSGAEALVEFYSNPLNPGDVLGYDPITGEFAAYDENDPWHKVEGFLLNFDTQEGLPDTTSDPAGTLSDGDDVIFGDLGNDWLVGGTGRDHLYGGRGDDLLNADDDHESGGVTNREPDTDPTYEDIAYGGAGRDRLIANTGGDRLIDWAGEFNTYIVPFSPFGIATVSRQLQPAVVDYLYQLSASDGADPTRAADEGSDPARNGEPYGELGLVRQQDPDWQDQTGGPDDPQPGNDGGSKDVLKTAAASGDTTATAAASDGFETLIFDEATGTFSSAETAPVATVPEDWIVDV